MTEPESHTISIAPFIYLGIFGGALLTLAECWAIRHVAARLRPGWVKDRFYWVVSLIMALTGGALVWIHLLDGRVQLSGWLAANIGASAPLIINSLCKHLPQMKPGKVD
jgi:hypothetical protein